jgi:biopolymer transport protein ExbD
MPKMVASSPGASGRHQRGRRIGPTLSEINVIPLVDVMLVLLIIFMVAAPMLQQGIEMNLPQAARADNIPEERMYLDMPASFSKDRQVFIDKEPVRLDFLAERLRQAMQTRKDRQVFIRSDGTLSVQDLITVFDELKAANVETAGIVTERPTR